MPVVAVAADDKDLGEIFVVFGRHGVAWDFHFAGLAFGADRGCFEVGRGGIRADWSSWLA